MGATLAPGLGRGSRGRGWALSSVTLLGTDCRDSGCLLSVFWQIKLGMLGRHATLSLSSP